MLSNWPQNFTVRSSMTDMNANSCIQSPSRGEHWLITAFGEALVFGLWSSDASSGQGFKPESALRLHNVGHRSRKIHPKRHSASLSSSRRAWPFLHSPVIAEQELRLGILLVSETAQTPPDAAAIVPALRLYRPCWSFDAV